MTGVALFFIVGSYLASRNLLVPVLVVLVASLFKLFDAYLLGLPVLHGAVGNPIFAFLLEGAAFLLLIRIFHRVNWNRTLNRALLGAGSALMAVALFPLVKFATGIPACVYPGTTVPLSVFFAPLAVAFSAITVPLGFIAGERMAASVEGISGKVKSIVLRHLISPSAAVVCLLVILAFRMLLNTGA
jgi:hypothetical protein